MNVPDRIIVPDLESYALVPLPRAMEILNLSETGLRRKIRAGLIELVKQGRLSAIRRSSLIAYIEGLPVVGGAQRRAVTRGVLQHDKDMGRPVTIPPTVTPQAPAQVVFNEQGHPLPPKPRVPLQPLPVALPTLTAKPAKARRKRTARAAKPQTMNAAVACPHQCEMHVQATQVQGRPALPAATKTPIARPVVVLRKGA